MINPPTTPWRSRRVKINQSKRSPPSSARPITSRIPGMAPRNHSPESSEGSRTRPHDSRGNQTNRSVTERMSRKMFSNQQSQNPRSDRANAIGPSQSRVVVRGLTGLPRDREPTPAANIKNKGASPRMGGRTEYDGGDSWDGIMEEIHRARKTERRPHVQDV